MVIGHAWGGLSRQPSGISRLRYFVVGRARRRVVDSVSPQCHSRLVEGGVFRSAPAKS